MATSPQHLANDSAYSLSETQISQFQKDGYIKLKSVLSPEAIEFYSKAITEAVTALNKESRPMKERDTYAKAFLQIMNIWTHNEVVKEFVFSQRLARIAAELMQITGVRMYHDQALYKEPDGGYTPWHADQYYWPLDTEKTVTAWIPLQAVPMEMGPLEFSVGSHAIQSGRDIEISDDSEKQIEAALKRSDLPIDSSPFDLGEVSFHMGYTFHRAGPNVTTNVRKVMTIIYMDEHMRLIEPKRQEHINDRNNWLPGSRVGEVIKTKLNPVLYSTEQ